MGQTRNLTILFSTLVIMMMGFGIIIPILPDLVVAFGGAGVEMGGLMAIFSAMQFLFSPTWGSLSDRFGRKPVLTLGVFGNALSMLALGLSTQLWMLFAARGLAGILSSATLPTAMAYISDSTDAKSRGGGMGVIGAAMGLGMILGPGAGGLLSAISLQAPFYFAAGLSLLAMLALWIALPESLPIEKRERAFKFQGPQLKAMWQSLSGPSYSRPPS
jgi:DHA1 family multidrug resistance protein-like MFS transporter